MIDFFSFYKTGLQCILQNSKYQVPLYLIISTILIDFFIFHSIIPSMSLKTVVRNYINNHGFRIGLIVTGSIALIHSVLQFLFIVKTTSHFRPFDLLGQARMGEGALVNVFSTFGMFSLLGILFAVLSFVFSLSISFKIESDKKIRLRYLRIMTQVYFFNPD